MTNPFTAELQPVQQLHVAQMCPFRPHTAQEGLADMKAESHPLLLTRTAVMSVRKYIPPITGHQAALTSG